LITNKLSHIALILDGNKRWAKKHHLQNLSAYNKGFENIKKITDHSLLLKLSDLTLFTLSSENFKRPSINLIYEIIYSNFSNLFEQLIKNNNIKIKIFGSRENLPNKVIEIFDQAEKLSSNNNSLNLNLAFNYGFKDEIKSVLLRYKKNINKINVDNEKEINSLFSLGQIKDPDILIRTGGYQRLSNFIMYNLTYTELFFTKTLWPDFTTEELDKIISNYSNIDRKYGL
jgi:undecaprenyl diphosphate synthase